MLRSKLIAKTFFTGIGFTGTVLALLSFLDWSHLYIYLDDFRLKFILLIFLVNLLISLFLNDIKNNISIKLVSQVKANISFGDLFQNNEIIVIPVNEYFDTTVDDKIISSKTLHGYFIKQYFGGNEKNLKKQISQSLSNTPPKEMNNTRKQGNKIKYPLGTVATVTKEDKIFYLVALTRFNENHRAEVKKSEYQRVLCDLFDYIEQNSQGKKVSLPLIGGGHSGVPLSPQKKLEFLLFSIALNDKLTLINGIEIVLHQDIKEEIDLNRIHYYYNILET